MTAPEHSDFPTEARSLESQIYGAAKLVVSYLSAKFEPLTPEEIDDYNLRVITNGGLELLQTGSSRTLDTGDPLRSAPVSITETYYRWKDEEQDYDSHVFFLMTQDAEDVYLCTIDMDDGEMSVNSGEAFDEVPPERLLAVYAQTLGSLSLVADSLIIAA
jgi:hypothetical protein